MKPESQQTAIAEACGWKIEKFMCNPPRPTGFGIPPEGCPSDIRLIPDYLSDLNAMHEVEKGLAESAWYEYISNLRHAVAIQHYQGRVKASSHPVPFELPWLINATAAQRAEAFLRTIGKWADDE